LSLLSLIPDLKVADIDQGCCGLGGTHGLSAGNAPASAEIGRRLGRALARDAYDGVVSECEACRMRLSSLSGLKARHPLEVLAESLGAP
jgi:glycerol-3-phosphate dehydrogenase subunit C